MASLLRVCLLALPLAAFAQRPVITAVVNAASYENGPVSPGLIVTIFGTNIGPPTLVNHAVGENGRLETERGATRVLVEGVPSPIIYASATQTAAVVPYEAIFRAAVNIQVQFQGQMSDSVVKLVSPISPGIFALDATGRAGGAIINQGGTINSPTNPAHPGEIVQVYFTGEGLLQQQVPTGGIATGPLVTQATFTAEVGGRAAEVRYTGAAPGNVFGFAQANVAIPSNSSGGNLPIVLRSGSAATQANLTVAVAAPVLPSLTSVFLIHGINQSAGDMNAFRGTLMGPNGLDLTQYTIDAGFNYSDCTQNAGCGAGCTTSAGAQRLAQYIININPPGDVVLVGYSLGGLIARDLIANNWSNVLGRYRIRLVTLGAPMLGYPYTSFDSIVSCGTLLREMEGNWRVATPPVPQLSAYLNDVTVKWRNGTFPGTSIWLAASGRFCAMGLRGQTGCRDANLRNDGVVCDDSAGYEVTTPVSTAPSRKWRDPSAIYAHTLGPLALIFGCTPQAGTNPVLSNPAPGPLLDEVLAAIRGTTLSVSSSSLYDPQVVLEADADAQRAFVAAAIQEGFPSNRADALTMLVLNRSAVVLPVLEAFIAFQTDRSSVQVAKAAEWIAFGGTQAQASIERLKSIDARFEVLSGRARDHAMHEARR